MKPPGDHLSLPILMKMNPALQTAEEKEEMLSVLSLGKRHQALNTIRYDTNDMNKIILSKIIIIFKHSWSEKVSIKIKERNDVQEILKNEANAINENLDGVHEKVNPGIIASSGYVWMDTQLSLVVSSLYGLTIAFILATFVLLVATGSIMIALISIVCIVGIVSVVLGMFETFILFLLLLPILINLRFFLRLSRDHGIDGQRSWIYGKHLCYCYCWFGC
jgi:hypothetical protein